ncbi:hypothetical protein EXE59_11210 [Nocardioides eburneiflavus]|uniref:Uncharacterized protein n=1 Tax=Nocardioides eburneiflavus TaxID=2518372 RepID=A0A4Z1CGK7_9ACTN|nr:hypothetical protein [Nocardioides eburneiflavus]TGN64467.1 hypothetical protein EXE59_11210 [Nocardioides eburneiflavus]
MFTIGRTITTTAIATTAAAVTFVFPGPGAAIPVDDVPAPHTDTVMVERPCYMTRPGWNTPGGWEQPVCHTEVRARVADPAPAVRRLAEDHMP